MDRSQKALEMVADGSVLGLGSGRAAMALLEALGRRVGQGLRVRGVPTSQETADQARRLGVPLISLEEIDSIDVTFDGADEVDPQCNLIKGWGGAMVREKIVASMSRRLVILVGSEKLVPVLGTRGRLPVEVVPFGLPFCRRRLRELGFESAPREHEGRIVTTDNGNHILDCAVTAMPDPQRVEESLRSVPGVVGTGLFVGMADTVLVQEGSEVRVLRRGSGRGAADRA